MNQKFIFKTIISFILLLAFTAITNLTIADGLQHTIPINSDLDAWKTKGPSFMSKWTSGIAQINPGNPGTLTVKKSRDGSQELINKAKGSLDIYTRTSFGDCTIEMELMTARDSNSGVYVMGQYEVQIKDSHGKEWFLGSSDMGGIIGTARPKMNAAKPFGKWQTLVINFEAPRFQNGTRITPATFVQVILNGKIVQENVPMEKGPTSGSLRNGEFEKGPLMLQGGLGAVAYRNIRITER